MKFFFKENSIEPSLVQRYYTNCHFALLGASTWNKIRSMWTWGSLTLQLGHCTYARCGINLYWLWARREAAPEEKIRLHIRRMNISNVFESKKAYTVASKTSYGVSHERGGWRAPKLHTSLSLCYIQVVLKLYRPNLTHFSLWIFFY